MRVTAPVRAAGDTHPGRHRQINEDRYHYDPARGIFIVVDGVGGQAAGEKAAETALSMLRARLERETGSLDDRVREAIAVANAEVYRQASLRPEWHGMACVLTVAVLDGTGGMTVGHVGDTRLYKLRHGEIFKLTRDHSPVGEREEAGELSELQAMRHPRRNEVYRDIGSEPHGVHDSDFVDVFHVPLEPDAAILLCSDGLTDCITSDDIRQIVRIHAGRPYEVVQALIGAANEAGGKDNITVVYAEASGFVPDAETRDLRRHTPAGEVPPLRHVSPSESPVAPFDARPAGAPQARRWWPIALPIVAVAIAVSAYALRAGLPEWAAWPAPSRTVMVVGADGSIAAAMGSAAEGTTILVEPGEYRERVAMRSGVALRSRVPRGAVLRLPGGAAESDPAVLAVDVTAAELAGFRIVGDAATPLGTGVFLQNTDLTIVDVEISGASQAAIELAAGARGSIVGADIHDNLGAGLIVRAGASPRIAHSVLERNARSGQAAGALFIEPGASPQFVRNVFYGIAVEALKPSGIDPDVLQRDNWFRPAAEPQAGAVAPRGRRGRGSS